MIVIGFFFSPVCLCFTSIYSVRVLPFFSLPRTRKAKPRSRDDFVIDVIRNKQDMDLLVHDSLSGDDGARRQRLAVGMLVVMETEPWAQ